MELLRSDTEDTVNLNDEILNGLAAAGTTGNKLVNVAQDFEGKGVKAGDLVINTNNLNCSRAASVDGDTVTLVTDIGFSSGDIYKIFAGSEEPATLYIGTVGANATLKVRTAGGDDVVLDNLVQGTTIPLQVVRIYSTGTTNVSDIVALF